MVSSITWRAGMLAIAVLVAVIGGLVTRQPAPVLADEARFYLECPQTSVREGDPVDVFLVRVTNHEHSVSFGAYWHTDAGTAGTEDYVHQDTGAIWGSESERLANRVKHTFQTRQDNLVEGNETFTARFSPTDHVVDPGDPDRDEQCEITIIDDDPNITAVRVTSRPVRGDTYGVGETVEISATFNADVEVDGNPGLGLWVGGNWRSAGYLRGSGTDTLVFGYRVQPSDSDSDGIRMDGGYRDSDGRWHNFLNHTAVTAVGTDAVAHRAYAGIDDQSGHRVDGSSGPYGTKTEITSRPANGDTYRYGETIEFSLTFSAELEVEGRRHLSLRMGSRDSDGWRGAWYRGGSGTSTLVFGYTVQAADLDEDGVTLLGTWTRDGVVQGLGGSGAVKVKGSDVDVTPTFSGLSDQSGHQVDGRPYPKTIAITSTPVSTPDTYGRDEVIQVSVNFGQKVDAGEDVAAILRIGSRWTHGYALYVSGSGTDSLVFEYTVREHDADHDGIDVFVPHGLDIRAAGTDVVYQPDPGGETPVVAAQSGHRVDGWLVGADTTSPTISLVSLSISPGPGDDSTYGVGDWIGVVVTFSESVLVTGSPQVGIDIGGVTRQAQYGHLAAGLTPPIEQVAQSRVLFGYTVQEGDADSDGIAIAANAVSLNGGTIRDAAGNDATLTHDAVSADSGHQVDAPGGS